MYILKADVYNQSGTEYHTLRSFLAAIFLIN